MPLAVFDESNVIDVVKWGRGGYSDLVNQITLVYHDAATDKDVPIVVQNLASIQAQGCTINETIERPGYSNQALASRAAMRELRVRSIPLAKGQMKVNRDAWRLLPGDQFILIWPKRRISSVIMRTSSVDIGDIDNNVITVDFIEDVFSIPSASYAETQPSLAAEEPTSPEPVSVWDVYEAPYWMLWSGLTATRLSELGDNAGYLAAVVQAPNGYHDDYALHSRVSPASFAETYSEATYNESALLTSDLSQTATSGISIESSSLNPAATLDSFGMIGSGATAEWVQFSGGDYASTINIKRGLFDTVQRAHPAGTRIWKVSYRDLYPSVTRVAPNVVTAAIVTRAPGGELDTDTAYGTTLDLTMNSRYIRPYTGGRFQLNSTNFPATLSTATVSVTWAHRDRTVFPAELQTSSTNVGPEVGATYTGYLYNADTDALVDSLAGITGTSWSCNPSFTGNFRIELEGVNGAFVSWQRQHCTFFYDYLSFADEEGDEFVTEESGDYFDMEY